MIKSTVDDDVMIALWRLLPSDAKVNVMKEVFDTNRLTKEMLLFCKTTWIDGSQKFPGLAYSIKKYTAIVIQIPKKVINTRSD